MTPPASAAELLAPAGECCRCHQRAEERVTVALVQGNSGPGWSQEACLPCARVYARSAFAPRWLREDLAAIDAARTLRVVK